MDEFYRIKRLPPVRLRHRQRPQDQGASPGRGRHRPRHGQSRPGHAQAHRRQARRGGAQSANHRYSASKGITRLRKAVTTWYRDRYGVELDPETEAIATIGAKEGMAHLALAVLQPGDGALVPEPDLSDPLLLGGHRRRRPALGAAGAGRGLLRPPPGDGAAVLAQGQAAHPVLPAQSDHDLRGPRLLRQGGRLRPGAPPDGGARLRLRRLHLRRLQAALVPRGAGSQGRRRRDLLAVEVLQHAGLADGLRVRQPRR